MTEQQAVGKGGEPNEKLGVSVGVEAYNPERIRERFFNDGVIDAAEHYGWRTFHLRDRQSIHIVRGRGFPDLVMFRKDPDTGHIELLAAELKRGYDSATTPEQDEWLEALKQHIPAYTWRPEEWAEIDDVLKNGVTGNNGNWQRKEEAVISSIPPNFGSLISNIIEAIESQEMTTGEKASLRRMNPSQPDSAVFWKLVSQHRMPRNFDIGKWGLITHGIALMSHTAGLAHNPRRPVGQVLYEGNGDGASQGFYSENRLAALLSARGETRHRLLARMFRMLANEGCPFNWREMAWFILNDGYDEQEAEKSCIEIARAYYRAEQRSN